MNCKFFFKYCFSGKEENLNDLDKKWICEKDAEMGIQDIGTLYLTFKLNVSIKWVENSLFTRTTKNPTGLPFPKKS